MKYNLDNYLVNNDDLHALLDFVDVVRTSYAGQVMPERLVKAVAVADQVRIKCRVQERRGSPGQLDAFLELIPESWGVANPGLDSGELVLSYFQHLVDQVRELSKPAHEHDWVVIAIDHNRTMFGTGYLTTALLHCCAAGCNATSTINRPGVWTLTNMRGKEEHSIGADRCNDILTISKCLSDLRMAKIDLGLDAETAIRRLINETESSCED